MNNTSQTTVLEYDFFVSYAREDNKDGFVTEFVKKLIDEYEKEYGITLKEWFDKNEIRSMDDWRNRLLEGLKASKLLLVFVSPNYLASEFCKKELEWWRDHEVHRYVLGEGTAPIYIVEVPNFENSTDPLITRLRESQTNLNLCEVKQAGGIGILQDQALENLLQQVRELANSIHERTKRVTKAEASPRGIFPCYNINFVGRRDDLKKLRDILTKQHAGAVASVQGIGGIGKSELAFTYAHAFAWDYPAGRFYAVCDNVTDFDVAVCKLGVEKTYGFTFTEEEKLPKAQAERVLLELTKRGKSLFIFDNVIEPGILTEERRRNLHENVQIIITTREEPAKFPHLKSHSLSLGYLSNDESLAMLEQYRPITSPEDQEAAKEIVKRLGGFTLAIEIIAAYLHGFATTVSYKKALEGLKARGIEFLDTKAKEKSVDNHIRHSRTIITELMSDVVAKLTDAEKGVLQYAALMPPDAVAVPWLKEFAQEKYPEIAAPPLPGDPDPWDMLYEKLAGLQLLSKTDEQNIARMHRLIQEAVNVRNKENVEALRDKLLDHAKSRTKFLVCDGWLHKENRWETAPLVKIVRDWQGEYDERVFRAGNAIGLIFSNLGKYQDAKELFEKTIAIELKHFELDNPNLAALYSNLGDLQSDTGCYPEAEASLIRALATYRELATKEPEAYLPDVALTLNGLGNLQSDTGRYPEAKASYAEALAISREFAAKEPGMYLPDVALTLNGLGNLQSDTKHYPETEASHTEALAISREFAAKEPGAYLPCVAAALNNLGNLQSDTGRYPEAKASYAEALAISREFAAKEPGMYLPDVALTLNNLGNLQSKTDRYPEAEASYTEALATYRDLAAKEPGAYLPDVALTLKNLGVLQYHTGRKTRAAVSFAEALAIAKRFPEKAMCQRIVTALSIQD